MVAVSIVIATHNQKEKVAGCLQALKSSTFKDYELIVVDDASSDGTSDFVKTHFPDANLLSLESEVWPSKARNLGAQKAVGEYLLFVDSDVIVDNSMLAELLEVFLRNSDTMIGVAVPVIVFADHPDIIASAGAEVNLVSSKTTLLGAREHLSKLNLLPREVGHSGCVSLIRQQSFSRVGGFDETDFPIHYEESDLCLRMKQKGFKVVLAPKARAIHNTDPSRLKMLGSQTRFYYTVRNRILFMKRHARTRDYYIFVGLFLPLFLTYTILQVTLQMRGDLVHTAFAAVQSGLRMKINRNGG